MTKRRERRRERAIQRQRLITESIVERVVESIQIGVVGEGDLLVISLNAALTQNEVDTIQRRIRERYPNLDFLVISNAIATVVKGAAA